MKKWVKVGVSLDFFTRLITNGTVSNFDERVTVEGGLPDGAELVRTEAQFDGYRQVLYFVYEHESFEEVPIDNTPTILPQLTKEYR